MHWSWSERSSGVVGVLSGRLSFGSKDQLHPVGVAALGDSREEDVSLGRGSVIRLDVPDDSGPIRGLEIADGASEIRPGAVLGDEVPVEAAHHLGPKAALAADVDLLVYLAG